MNAFAQGGKRGWLAVGYSHCRVTTTDSAHGAVSIHLVESREGAGRYRPVTGGGVGNHRAHDDVVGLRQNLAVDHVGLFPQNMAVECPDVRHAIHLGFFRQVDHP